MSINDYNCRAPVGSKELNTVYVFFCEGSTEANFIDMIHQKRILNSRIKIRAVQIPNQKKDQDKHKYFTPQRILDYYREMRGLVDDWKYECSYSRPSEDDRKKADCELVRKNDTKICLLIDTDVFFKTERIYYANLNEDDMRTLWENYRDMPDVRKRHALAKRIALLNRYFYCPIKEQEYIFMEQELNFEDFFVLLFMNGDIYKRWFNRRFGTENANEGYTDRSSYFGGELDNRENGDTIKHEFHKITEVEENIFTWLSRNARDISAWVECVKTANRRMKKNESRKNGHGNSVPTRWPYRFGLIKFLAEHIKQGNENGK